MNRYISFVVVVFCLVFLSCSNGEKKVFTVKGSVKNIDKMLTQFPNLFVNDSIKLMLYELPFGADGTPVQLDSVYITKSKTDFSLEGQTRGTGLYEVIIENGPFIPVVNDAENVTLDIDMLNSDRYYAVQGSQASNQIRDFIFNYTAKTNQANLAFNRLDSLKLRQATDSVIIAATNEKNASIEAVNNYLKNFLTTVDNSTVAAFILGTAANTLPMNEFEAVLNKMIQKYPADSNLAYFKNQLDAKKYQAAAREQASPNLWVGKQSPELVLPDANGKNIALSSFKGKYVLVDFWASWCGPCRVENPNVVEAYNRFKDKNFTILGVSLDKEKQNWLEAIKKDNLTWTHISDLAFWESKAVETFQFQGIPYNVLIDPQGKIIAEGLRGTRLMETLQEVLPN
jgi:peroxiredoxin